MQKHEITTAVSPRNDNLIRATCSKCGVWYSAQRKADAVEMLKSTECVV